MDNDKLEDLKNSVGASAEMLWMFFSQLKRVGFDDGAAFGFCSEMLRCIILGRPSDAE